MTHVLLVEDDEHLLYALARSLEASGFAITAVHDAQEALAALEGDSPIDVVVTDIHLGENAAHGISLAQMARLRRKGVPVIFITAFPENLKHAKPHGPVLLKPVDAKELERLICHQCGRPAA